ncbi:hypothetical protein B0H19DRAFT_1247533 [Mycena capillaripes]|nr:hypothetical protein B0H19DRAFT_1247533 [Mycena capillaripes]
MAPGAQSCDWTADPNDKIALIAYFKTIKHKIGQGGSWDQPALELTAAHMNALGPRAKGAPKNASSVKGVWTGMKKIHDALVLVIVRGTPVPTPIQSPSGPSDPSGRSPGHRPTGTEFLLFGPPTSVPRAFVVALTVIQKRYPGASGWTYDQQAGFSVCDDNHDAWKEFSKQHTVFKLFANKGWDFFDDVKEILPTRARGVCVFNPAVATATPSQDSNDAPQLHLSESYDFPDPSQLLNNSQPQLFAGYWPQTQSQALTDWSQTQSQFFSDWSQTQFGVGDLTQPIALTTPTALTTAHMPTPVPDAPGPASALIPATPANTVRTTAPPAPTALGTPSSGVKRTALDEFQTPWTAKKGKTSGADVLLSIGRSIDRIGNTIRDCFTPQKSSAVSPTKQIERACNLAVDDQAAGSLTSQKCATLNLIFSKDPKAADTYVAEETSEGRSALAEILIERF